MKLPFSNIKIEQKRFEEWTKWLSIFRTQTEGAIGGLNFSIIPNAAWLLNDLYWRIVRQYLRPILAESEIKGDDHLIHQYKILSASEITVMMVLPISIPNDLVIQKSANALLAWFVATQIIENWSIGSEISISAEHINKIASYKENIDPINRYPQSFAADHIQWLTELNVAIEKPILINAQCWRLFYIACLSLASKGDLK